MKGDHSPLSTTGGLGEEFRKVIKKAASRTEDKHGERYPEMNMSKKSKKVGRNDAVVLISYYEWRSATVHFWYRFLCSIARAPPQAGNLIG